MVTVEQFSQFTQHLPTIQNQFLQQTQQQPPGDGGTTFTPLGRKVAIHPKCHSRLDNFAGGEEKWRELSCDFRLATATQRQALQEDHGENHADPQVVYVLESGKGREVAHFGHFPVGGQMERHAQGDERPERADALEDGGVLGIVPGSMRSRRTMLCSVRSSSDGRRIRWNRRNRRGLRPRISGKWMTVRVHFRAASTGRGSDRWARGTSTPSGTTVTLVEQWATSPRIAPKGKGKGKNGKGLDKG